MKPRPTHRDLPQTEGHPEGFPKVNTIPDGWDLSDVLTKKYNADEPFDPDLFDDESAPWNLDLL
ncbi:MAG TPA: hypothetical protein VMT46_03600 [Anaerolineaceae bacterium]|nr:hypothetical protein [Anaerolineaceae bacterium]